MLCPRSGNGIPYLALRPTRNRLVIQYIFIKCILKGSKNLLPLDIGSVNYKQAGRILLFSLDDYSLEEWTEAVNYISQTR